MAAISIVLQNLGIVRSLKSQTVFNEIGHVTVWLIQIAVASNFQRVRNTTSLICRQPGQRMLAVEVQRHLSAVLRNAERIAVTSGPKDSMPATGVDVTILGPPCLQVTYVSNADPHR